MVAPRLLWTLLFIIDAIGSYSVDRLCRYVFDQKLWKEQQSLSLLSPDNEEENSTRTATTAGGKSSSNKSAVEVEEGVLAKERKDNERLLVLFGILGCGVVGCGIVA